MRFIGISRAKCHCNRLTTVRGIQDYAAAAPSPFLAVRNVTAHPSMESVPTSIIRCGTIITGAY